MLDYKAESWNPTKGRSALMHREVGYLHINNKTPPNSGEGDSFKREFEVALVLAHNFGAVIEQFAFILSYCDSKFWFSFFLGVAEVLTGTVSSNKLILNTSSIGRMPFAAEPPAVKV